MITIREYKTEDLESVMDIWNEVVREGIAFPQDEELTKLNEDIIPHYILLKQIPFYQTRKRNDTERINNIHMDVKQFIQNFRDAFGQKAALPLLFGYSNQPIADTERINGCIFKGLQAAREGVPVSLSAEVIACGGGKLYTGFTDMPERVPGFVSLKEKYKKTPQMVIDYVEDLVVSMTIVENARKGQRCFMGLLDPSVRPYVGTNELSFTIPMSRFKSMTKTMKECFLFDSHAWKKVKARLAE